MHQPERLRQLLAHREPHASVVGVVAKPLGPDQVVEVRRLNLSVVVHGLAP